jgi:hypothetical protein
VTTTAPPKPKYSATRAVALIDDHRCGCPDCPGALATSDWPSWRRCTECGCCWKVGTYDGRRLADYFRGGCRVEAGR